MSDEAHLLVIGSGAKEFREDLFRSISGSNVWLFTERDPTWQNEYINGCTVVSDLKIAKVSADFAFLDGHVRELLRSAPIKGVLTFDEAYLPAACRIADELGLPSLGPDAAENCRNKERTRRILTAAGVPQPRFAVAKSEEEAVAIADDFGYPFVLKPRGLAGSIGVVKVRSSAEIVAGFRMVMAAEPSSSVLAPERLGGPASERHGGGILVEEFLEGLEVAVDSAVIGGKLEPLYVVRKRFGPEPFFEETGQTVNADDPLLHDVGLIETLRTAAAALELRDGMTHIEVKLTAAGPAIVEVNGRLAGDFVPHIAKLATGLDGALVAARVACGEPVDLGWTRSASAAHQIFYSDRAGIFNGIEVPSPATHEGVVASGPLIAPGTEVLLPPKAYMLARCGFVMVAAASAEDCDAALAGAVSAVSVDVTPAD